MKNSTSSNTIVNRKSLLFLGVLLSLLVFGVLTWRTDASGSQDKRSAKIGDQDKERTASGLNNNEIRERFEQMMAGRPDDQDQNLRQTTKEEAMAILRSDYFDEMDAGSQMKYQIIAGEKKIEGVIKPFDFDAARLQRPVKISFFPFAEGGRELTSPFINVLLNDPSLDVTSANTQSETSIVLGAGGNIASSFNDSGSNAVTNNKFTGYSTSSNLGGAWTDRHELPTAAGNGDAGDPVMARNNTTGTILLATLNFNVSNQLNVYRSTDNGVTFGAAINGTTGTVGGSHDKEWLAVDNFPGAGNGNAYLFWRDFGTTSGMRLTRSTNDGVTWALTGGLIGTGTSQGAQVAVGPDHSVYVQWLAGSNIVIRRSTDQGVTFGSPVTVTPILSTGVNGDLALGAFRTSTFPQLAVNPVNGNLYTVYPDNPAGVDRADIFFRQSTDNGATWSAAVRVNTDAGTNDQWQSALAVTPDGTALFVGFYDRRRSATNTRYEYWGRTATISGSTVTFGCNFPIGSTDSAVVVGVDPLINTTYMGDYDTVVADNTNFYSNFADNRSGNPDSRNTVIPKAGPVGGTQAFLGFASQNLTTVTANSCNSLTVTISNDGCNATAGPVTGTLSTTTPGVTISNATQNFGTINGGATGSNAAPFQVSVASNFSCGATISATLTMNTGEVIPVSIASQGLGYNINSTTGTFTATGTLVAGTADDDTTRTITTPFAFSLYGNPVTAGQTITVSTNGNIQFVAAGGSSSLTNAALPSTAFGATTAVLMPYWDDLDMTPTITSGGGIYTETTGAAPNRIFKVEWRARHFISGQPLGAPDTNFAVFFHEGSNSFEYVYNTAGAGAFAGGISATVGLQAATTGTTFTQFSFNTASLSAGLQLNVSQPGSCPQGAGPCAAAAISGVATYGNAIPAATRFVSNVLLSGAGSPNVSTTTAGLGATEGQYVLTGFGAGAYTVTPTKTTGVNGSIASFDAARVALHVAGTTVLTGNQLVVADVSASGTISSLDAAMIAKFAAGPPFAPPGIGVTSNWRFLPANRNYASVTNNITSQDYSALLMGEVSGNWTNNGTRPVGGRQSLGKWPIVVSAPRMTTGVGKDVVIPIKANGVANNGLISYEFNLKYDPTVLQPQADPVDVTGTASRGLSFEVNAQEAGILRVVVYGAMPIDANGVLLNLRFTAVGTAGSVSPIALEQMIFNDGDLRINTTNGQIVIGRALGRKL